MKNNNLLNMLKKELKELFRDKKSLAMMLVIPIFIPLLVIGMSALFEMQVNKDVEEYNKIGFTYELSQEEQEIAKNMNIEIIKGTEEELKEKYENGEINLYVTKLTSKKNIFKLKSLNMFIYLFIYIACIIRYNTVTKTIIPSAAANDISTVAAGLNFV